MDAKTKAVILSAIAKLTKFDASLKDPVNAVLSHYESYWDEDIQQWAVEYKTLMNDVAGDVFATAFEELPSYPDEMQTDSVLMRWMSEIKHDKGFKSGEKESGKKVSKKSESYRASVSSALTSNTADDLRSSMASVTPDMVGADDKEEELIDFGGLGG